MGEHLLYHFFLVFSAFCKIVLPFFFMIEGTDGWIRRVAIKNLISCSRFSAQIDRWLVTHINNLISYIFLYLLMWNTINYV